MICTIPVGINNDDNYIELIGSTVPATRRVAGDEVKYFLAEKTEEKGDYFIIGFSDQKASNLTDLKEIKMLFAKEYVEAKKRGETYRREHSSGDHGSWGHHGLYRDVEYFEYLAEQCHHLIQHEGEHSRSFWREKSNYMNFTKLDFKGKGGYYHEYLPVQHIDVDGVDIVFDPNDIAQKAKKNGVVYQSVDEMLAFANAGDLAYSEGGVVDE